MDLGESGASGQEVGSKSSRKLLGAKFGKQSLDSCLTLEGLLLVSRVLAL